MQFICSQVKKSIVLCCSKVYLQSGSIEKYKIKAIGSPIGQAVHEYGKLDAGKKPQLSIDPP